VTPPPPAAPIVKPPVHDVIAKPPKTTPRAPADVPKTVSTPSHKVDPKAQPKLVVPQGDGLKP
jgi:hypothetical protein